ncbi:MAG TPA: tetratricopeptide repeat protein, partial [Chthoniobacterales bacterium]|nr:tetratricopeptide repeat protein [Chthoniobacterales bacterium]
ENCLTLIEAGPTVEEQNFPTIVEPPPLPPTVETPAVSRRKSSRAILWALAVLVLLAAGGLLFLKTRQSAESHPQIDAPSSSASSSATSTPAIAERTIAPSAASTSPSASLGKSPELTRDALAEAEKFEAARDWPRAVMAYVQMQKNFPQSEVGRVRLELLLSKLESEKDALRDDNFDALREPLTEAAKLGVVSAMEILGDFLRKRDPKGSFAWLCAAAASGRGHAMAEVGLRYSNGAGVERDLVKAAQWFEQAWAAGDVSAGTLLAECYLLGKGVTKNETKAIALLQDAAAAHDPRAMDQLGTCYHKGIGVARDDRKAFRFYNAASNLNYLDSRGNLGVLYLTSDETDLGKDETARTEKAVNLFREGAKQNNAFCMFLYARCFELGTGVDENLGEATDWYRRAAEAGNRQAQDWCRQHNVKFNSE